MTKVVYRTQMTDFWLDVQGHATGNQDVCAAVSAITQTLVGYLHNLKAVDEADIRKLIAEDGHLCVAAKGRDKCKHAFDMAYFGLCQLAHNFPEQVSVEK